MNTPRKKLQPTEIISKSLREFADTHTDGTHRLWFGDATPYFIQNTIGGMIMEPTRLPIKLQGGKITAEGFPKDVRSRWSSLTAFKTSEECAKAMVGTLQRYIGREEMKISEIIEEGAKVTCKLVAVVPGSGIALQSKQLRLAHEIEIHNHNINMMRDLISVLQIMIETKCSWQDAQHSIRQRVRTPRK